MGLEVSDWVGMQSPALSAHVHDEAQLSIVYSGCRRFRIGAATYSLRAGDMILIPAGVPHASVGIQEVETRSRDIFLDSSQASIELGDRLIIGAIQKPPLRQEHTVEEFLFDLLSGRTRRETALCPVDLPFEIIETVKSTSMRVSEIAKSATLSREGFIRKFTREIGMTPLSFRLAHKAARARALLRSAVPPAAAAYEAGFADQSHLGRTFKQRFGTSPAKFQRMWLN